MSNVTCLHTPKKTLSPVATRSSIFRCISASAAEHHTAVQYSNTEWNTTKASFHQRSIFECSPGFPKDTYQGLQKLLWKPSQKCSSKSYQRIKCHSQYVKINRLFQHSPTKINEGDRWCIEHDLETITVLLAFIFIIQNLTPLNHWPCWRHGFGTACACHCCSNAYGWLSSKQSGVIAITDLLPYKKIKAYLYSAKAHQSSHHRACVAILTMIFLLITYLLDSRELWDGGGLLATLTCSISLAEHGSIIDGLPLETCQCVWRYSQKKRHWQYRRYVGGITSCHCYCHW